MNYKVFLIIAAVFLLKTCPTLGSGPASPQTPKSPKISLKTVIHPQSPPFVLEIPRSTSPELTMSPGMKASLNALIARNTFIAERPQTDTDFLQKAGKTYSGLLDIAEMEAVLQLKQQYNKADNALDQHKITIYKLLNKEAATPDHVTALTQELNELDNTLENIMTQFKQLQITFAPRLKIKERTLSSINTQKRRGQLTGDLAAELAFTATLPEGAAPFTGGRERSADRRMRHSNSNQSGPTMSDDTGSTSGSDSGQISPAMPTSPEPSSNSSSGI